MKRRGPTVIVKSAKRPVEKEIIVQQDTVGTVQVSNTIHTSTVAETFSGGNIEISLGPATNTGFIVWALMYVKGGQATPALSVADNSNLVPESSILATGVYQSVASTQPVVKSFRVKTSRKMLGDDQIVFASIGSAAACASIMATITLFFKQ